MKVPVIIISSDLKFYDQVSVVIDEERIPLKIVQFDDPRIFSSFLFTDGIYLLDRLPTKYCRDLIHNFKQNTELRCLFIIRDSFEYRKALDYSQLGASDFISLGVTLCQMLKKLAVMSEQFDHMYIKATYKQIDFENQSRVLTFNGHSIKFTKTEYKTLIYLFSARGKIAPANEIASNIFENNVTIGNIHVQIHNIKQKLRNFEAFRIEKIPKRGYKISIAS